MEFRGMDFKIALEHQNTDGFQVKHKHFRGKKLLEISRKGREVYS